MGYIFTRRTYKVIQEAVPQLQDNSLQIEKALQPTKNQEESPQEDQDSNQQVVVGYTALNC